VSGSAISTNDVPEHSEMETPPQKNSGVIDLMLIDGTPFHVDSCIIDSIECDAIGTIVVTQRGARVYVLDSPERIAALREAVR
jgi:hypothetical protein